MKITQGPNSMIALHKWIKNKNIVSLIVKGQEVRAGLKASWLDTRFTWAA